jgi:hypothetical protein
MFDAQTIELISRAPALEGLDLAALPQRLTDAYATIVATRVRLRRLAPGERALPEATVALLGEMRKLAFAHEALVSVLPERDDRAAAAFVAGAAHHVEFLRAGPFWNLRNPHTSVSTASRRKCPRRCCC